MTPLDSTAAKNLQPSTTMKLAEALGRAEFAAKLSAPVLLVRLVDSDQREVAQTLLQTLSSATLPLIPTLGFRTVASVRGERTVGGLMPWAPKDIGPRVRALLSENLHVAVPLRKRPDSTKSFTERISIGRAMNNDVVLRHESISKFHAWIESDESGRLFASDAGSRNGTFIDGARLTSKVSVHVPFGAELRFAAIAAILCRAETLWDALHDAPEPA